VNEKTWYTFYYSRILGVDSSNNLQYYQEHPKHLQIQHIAIDQDIHHVGTWDVQQERQQVVVHVLVVIVTAIV
jgi:hypothetical protein